VSGLTGEENDMIPETFRSAKILIVDDERATVRLLEQLLERAGCTNLKTTLDPREALACSAAFQPDLILLDLPMPHVSGLEILARLKRQTAVEPYLPVLILTADAAVETKRRALAAGASDVVTKPFDPTELLLRVRNLLEMRFLHQELRRQNEGLEAQVHERTRQLVQTEKLATMGNLLAGVAHELNSPLSVILGRVALFEAATHDDRARECAQGIGEAAERCVRIVRSFLTMARRQPPERGHVALSQVLQDALELLAYELRVADVEVCLDLAADLPTVWADGHRLQQAAVNLIANAHQAMRDAPLPRRLDVVARWDGGSRRVHIEIADTGPGIAPEIQARVFEPFFSTKPEGEGTGLGLALTRGIIEEHGGVIRLESRPGAGTRFLIELPAGAAPVVRDDGGALDAGPPVPGKRILVVDDEHAVASILAEALTRDGYTVDTAANGAAALRRLEVLRYDLIISDSGMPVLNGPELYREVERREPHLARRFVFLTGDVLNPRIQEFLEEVDAPRLDKPFTLDSVKRMVRRVLLAQ
jgi:signal transduction histidine kinase